MNAKDIRGCLVILVLSLGLGLGVNSISPDGIPVFGQWDKEAGVIMAGTNDAQAVQAQEINNPLKVRQLIDNGSVVLIDVRLRDAYEQGHLPGALSFPLMGFDGDRIQARVKADDEVLLYCSGVTCHDSHTFGGRLIKMGFTRVSVYAGGFTEWKEMGFKVETDYGNN